MSQFTEKLFIAYLAVGVLFTLFALYRDITGIKYRKKRREYADEIENQRKSFEHIQLTLMANAENAINDARMWKSRFEQARSDLVSMQLKHPSVELNK